MKRESMVVKTNEIATHQSTQKEAAAQTENQNLCSACRSTPTIGPADIVEWMTGPKTLTSFNSISIETAKCLNLPKISQKPLNQIKLKCNQE